MKLPIHRSPTIWAFYLVAAVFSTGGCRKSAQPASQPVPTTAAQAGMASWYGHPFDGRATASGEIYDMEKMTAAHRTLPLGTVVRVTSQITGQKVDVRVNDRGPFVKDRIIDLSHAAAQAIAMPGVAMVSLDILSRPRTRGVQVFAVQIGFFASRAEGTKLQTEMAAKYSSAELVFRPGDQNWHLLVGSYPLEAAANNLAAQLSATPGGAYVVLMDSAE